MKHIYIYIYLSSAAPEISDIDLKF